MPIEAMLVIVTLLAIAVAVLCVAVLYRMRSSSAVISPVLEACRHRGGNHPLGRACAG
jgi:hypothetical protein